jgi:hypothetical protein
LTAQILSLIGGLVTGLITRLVFERRATKATRQQNEELRSELSVLRATVLSLGGHLDDDDDLVAPEDLADAVAARAISTQDSSGRVNRGALVAYFMQRGHDARDVEVAIATLCDTGALTEEGSWLQMA